MFLKRKGIVRCRSKKAWFSPEQVPVGPEAPFDILHTSFLAQGARGIWGVSRGARVIRAGSPRMRLIRTCAPDANGRRGRAKEKRTDHHCQSVSSGYTIIRFCGSGNIVNACCVQRILNAVRIAHKDGVLHNFGVAIAETCSKHLWQSANT